MGSLGRSNLRKRRNSVGGQKKNIIHLGSNLSTYVLQLVLIYSVTTLSLNLKLMKPIDECYGKKRKGIMSCIIHNNINLFWVIR